MTVQAILKMGNPILRQVADPIEDPTSDDVRALVADMRDSLKAVGGVGLAAPQIGVPLALVIFEVPPERAQAADGEEADGVEATILINPVIEPLSDETALDWEGCLSVPGLRGVVPRHTHIRYSGLDLDGNRISVEAEGFHARVVQHECDHLNGILYPQRMTDMRYLVYEEEMEAFMDSLRKPAEDSAENEPEEESER